MPQAAIFDVDGTLVDSVDLHARAWQEALEHFGHHASFEQCRSQIGKGGDQLIPMFLSEAEQKDHGPEMEEWRGKLFKSSYLPLVRPFSAVPELLQRVRATGLKIAVASSATTSELDIYLEIAHVRDLADVRTSSDDVEQSKPAPDIFQVALRKLGLTGSQAVAIGDTPYDAEAAGKAGITTIGLLCGGFAEAALRQGGCISVYPGPAALLACFDASPLAAASLSVDEPAEAVKFARVENGIEIAPGAEAPRPSSAQGSAPTPLEIYRSSNGDRWHLVGDPSSGLCFVRHKANPTAGGHVTDFDVDGFLSTHGASPQALALIRALPRG